MNNNPKCPECGAALAGGATLCPECLIGRGLENTSVTPGLPDKTVVVGQPIGAAAPKMPVPGEEFGRYRIVRLLGRGGMGEVYEASHIESGRRVALKVMSQAFPSADDRKRFLREGRLAAAVSHPNTVYIYGTEEIADHPIISMELVGDGTLKDRVRRKGPLPIAEAVDLILHVIAGLEAAHAAGVLHRDIKPANCFVGSDGVVKVGDFGLSISTLARGESLITASGSVLGTPSFASPEQLRGQELTVASDIYSVGATLYYLLTGKPPLDAQELVKLIAEVLDRLPDSPQTRRPEIPSSLARTVLRCLAKNRADRYSNYAALRDALLPFASAAPTPAKLGLRFVAGAVDDFIGMFPMLALVAYTGFDPFARLHTLPHALTAAGCFLWNVLYYAVPEGLWGAALGKAACGLRVVDRQRNTPGLWRALARALIYVGLFVLPSLVQAVVLSEDQLAAANAAGQWLVSDWVWLLLLAALFSTMRRRNGFAALHDLLTGTRVIARASAGRRDALESARATPLASEPARRIGPYLVLGALRRNESEELLLGHDDTLRRRVWIQMLPAGTPAVAARRRDLSRAGRLRWLNGQRPAVESWDAYEAPDGRPFVEVARAPSPWSAVRFWLLDLAEEIHAANKDEAPPVLSFDRVWITMSGRAMLLDFPGPLAGQSVAATGVPHGGTSRREGGAVEVVSRDPGRRDASHSMSEPINGGLPMAAMQEFLDGFAGAALNGLTPGEEIATTPLKVPLPLHATPFLGSLRERSFEAAEILLGNLQSLVGKVAAVSRRRRVATLTFAPVGVALLAALTAATILFTQHRWDRTWAAEHPGLPSLRRALEAFDRKWEDNSLHHHFYVYFSGHFGKIIADSNFWARPEVSEIISQGLRERARRAVTREPNPTPEELKKADDVALPLIAGWERFERLQMVWLGLGIFAALLTILVVIPELGSALLFREGMMLRLFGVAVVTKQGERASRLRLFWRSVAAWMPFLMSLPVLILLGMAANGEFQASVPLLMTLLGATSLIFAAGLAWAVWKPARGLQDVLAGTSLVPR